MKRFIIIFLAAFVTTTVLMHYFGPEQHTALAPEIDTELDTESEVIIVDETIMVTTPEPFAIIESPLEVTGSARGHWFFEATAPAFIENSQGDIVGEGFIQAEGDWMTEEMVAFSGVITLTIGATDTGADGVLVLKKQNASGLPERDDERRISIVFGDVTDVVPVVVTPPGLPTVPLPVVIGTAETFSGVLSEVNTGCYADGECYAVVGGKHVTAIMGWSRDTVGSIQGAPSFGDLDAHIGEAVEVFAAPATDGKYTLYGSADFYIKVTE